MGSQSDFMRHMSSAIVELRLFTIRAALAWICCRGFSAEGEQFPHTEIPYVTLGMIVLKYISSRTFLGRILILFNAPTFCAKCFFIESSSNSYGMSFLFFLINETQPLPFRCLKQHLPKYSICFRLQMIEAFNLWKMCIAHWSILNSKYVTHRVLKYH